MKGLLLLLCLLLVLLPSAALAAGNSSVGFGVRADGGKTLQMTFVAKQTGDVYAYELDFTFDEQRLKLKEASVGHNGFLVTPIVEGDRIRIAHTLVGPKPGLAGDIELVTVVFERIAMGVASVTLDEVKLVDAAIQTTTYAPALKVYAADSAFTINDMDGHWAKKSIEEAVLRDIVHGYSDGTFRPEHKVTRAEFAALLVRALELPAQPAMQPAFADAERIPAWAAPSIAMAAEAGLITGYDDGAFRAERPIVRAEMTAMLVRAMGDAAPTASAFSTFADADQIPGWAKSAVATAAEANIIHGKPGNRFAPNEHTTRAEAVVAILNLLYRK